MPENRENTLFTGWKQETNKYMSKMNSFLQTRFSSPHETRPHYDSTQELHFSGENWDVMQSLAAGQAKLLEVNVLYTNNVPEQIHAVYAGGETGQNIDVYLKGNALKDYLNK